MAEGGQRWEAAELIAVLDEGVAPRLLATHPVTGWCRSCRISAPCPARTLAEAVALVGRGRAGGPASCGRRAAP
ncbi:MAG: hypothetical protein ACRDRK_14305 [Pseudonocardia sp.]